MHGRMMGRGSAPGQPGYTARMIEVLGRYELLRMLGRGGMAEVYLARRRVAGLEKRLVVKRIRRERAGDPAILDLFMREARLSMSLGHQNVVPVFDFGRIGDDAFLAMEYVDGRDLGSTLARAARPLPPLLAAHIASECCRALDHAHHRRAPDGGAAGVIHRDVTPRNVLLSWAGEVKLTDFGVATLASDGDDQIRGTWAYMAPEQARGEPLDGRADLYALGLVLWSMIAGTRPRAGDDPASLRERARSGELPPPPDGPPALIAVAVRATEPDRERRFADAHDMQDALDAYLIAARAETPGLAPERQLAAWLAAVWGDDARRVESSDDDPGEVLTVDLPADRTQRSVAATMADEAELGPAAVGSDPTLAGGAGEASSVPAAASPAPRRRARRVLVGLGVLAAGTVAVGLAATRPWTSAARSTVDPTATVAPSSPPAAVNDRPAGPPDDTTSPRPSAASTGVSAGPTPAAAASEAEATTPGGAGHRRVTPATTAGSAGAAPDPIPDRAPRPATPTLRQVTIGATPWADFTVDDDPTPHQTPETLELPPGQHRIHLHNPTIGVERTITLDVPVDHDVRHVERLQP